MSESELYAAPPAPKDAAPAPDEMALELLAAVLRAETFEAIPRHSIAHLLQANGVEVVLPTAPAPVAAEGNGHGRDRKLGFRDGGRWAVAWLHNHAKTMTDPHALHLLNGAAFGMGNALAKASPVFPSPPEATAGVGEPDEDGWDTAVGRAGAPTLPEASRIKTERFNDNGDVTTTKVAVPASPPAAIQRKNPVSPEAMAWAETQAPAVDAMKQSGVDPMTFATLAEMRARVSPPSDPDIAGLVERAEAAADDLHKSATFRSDLYLSEPLRSRYSNVRHAGEGVIRDLIAALRTLQASARPPQGGEVTEAMVDAAAGALWAAQARAPASDWTKVCGSARLSFLDVARAALKAALAVQGRGNVMGDDVIGRLRLLGFIRESNAIEGIIRKPLKAEIAQAEKGSSCHARRCSR